jgi:hypothetical protein
MTPEQLQEKIEFIIQSQANSSARMDRLEADLDQMKEDHKVFRASLGHQKENIDGLMQLSRQLLEIVQSDRHIRDAERRVREAELRTREAELQAERERQRKLEGRVDGIEEMTKLLRELLENNLRRPEKPPEPEN